MSLLLPVVTFLLRLVIQVAREITLFGLRTKFDFLGFNLFTNLHLDLVSGDKTTLSLKINSLFQVLPEDVLHNSDGFIFLFIKLRHSIAISGRCHRSFGETG